MAYLRNNGQADWRPQHNRCSHTYYMCTYTHSCAHTHTLSHTRAQTHRCTYSNPWVYLHTHKGTHMQVNLKHNSHTQVMLLPNTHWSRHTHKLTSQKNEISLFLHNVASVHSSKRILNTGMKNYGSSNNTYISIAQKVILWDTHLIVDYPTLLHVWETVENYALDTHTSVYHSPMY